MNFLILLLILICDLRATVKKSQPHKEIRAVIRIDKFQNRSELYSLQKGTLIPSTSASLRIKQKISNLSAGAEALVVGYIEYQLMTEEDSHKLRPFFVIEEIHPLTLKDLGHDANIVSPEKFLPFDSPTTVYSPPSFSVTNEVISAITLTTSLLMLEDLTAQPKSFIPRQQQQRLLLSTGAMATMLFLYDQFKGNTKP